MRKLIAILAVALAIPTMSFALGEGRYQMIKLTESSVWILDTKTGMLKSCGMHYQLDDNGRKIKLFDLTKAPYSTKKVDASK